MLIVNNFNTMFLTAASFYLKLYVTSGNHLLSYCNHEFAFFEELSLKVMCVFYFFGSGIPARKISIKTLSLFSECYMIHSFNINIIDISAPMQTSRLLCSILSWCFSPGLKQNPSTIKWLGEIRNSGLLMANAWEKL